MSAICTTAARPGSWQSLFLALLPALERQARRYLVRLPAAEQDEARQYILAAAAVAVARLAERGRAELAYPAPLARYGYRHYRAGRVIGGSASSRDVLARRCQQQQRFGVESLNGWQETLPETHRTTPAELAALRLDFAAWLKTLTPRDRQLVATLVQGEATSRAAQKFGVTAGRVSQLRRELLESWQQFVGDLAPAN